DYYCYSTHSSGNHWVF
nr:immunoglobulin light chain junction region [Macaca mulatta]MOX41798.1 immunoglobulin light chain junction region [Macaca mulatta]MOX41877.1 immunoglobulin light chain junction region [Macaca mulatta]MOX42372.1 immunoglobulin light chain junction region [Macaca mulatta]MOX42411.1 immunoglobulin light chain junction region [Macaca mulatta]